MNILAGLGTPQSDAARHRASESSDMATPCQPVHTVEQKKSAFEEEKDSLEADMNGSR